MERGTACLALLARACRRRQMVCASIRKTGPVNFGQHSSSHTPTAMIKYAQNLVALSLSQ